MAEAADAIERVDFDLATTNFLKWFEAADGTRLSPKVKLQDLRNKGAGRAAVANTNIEEDEELFTIPRNLVLTTTTSSIPPTVLEPLNESGSWPPLIVTIIYEYLRHASSPWYPYFQVLPTTFDSLMFWNEVELGTLQASAVVSKIGKDDAEENWRQTIIPVMLSHPQLFPVSGNDDSEKSAKLMELAHMAGSLIMAYAFDIDRDEQGRQINDADDEFEEDDEDEPLKGMVPFADMLNADADRNNGRLYQETDCLIMKSTKLIAAGEQIFNDYGPLPRSDLLRMYGYLTENYAQYDVVEISHELLLGVSGLKHGTEHTAWLRHEEQLEELGIIDDGYALPRPARDVEKLEDAIPAPIHMLLRAMCPETDKKPKDAVTIREAALLQSVLMKRLSEYGTALEADRDTLKTLLESSAPQSMIAAGCSGHRYTMALQVRIGEKEILHQLIELCQSHIAAKTSEMSLKSGKRPLDEDNLNGGSRKAARKNKSRR